MFKRDIFVGLEKWRNDDLRKPLVLRGPRQVGKTTVVNEFGKHLQIICIITSKMRQTGRFSKWHCPWMTS